jgi:pyruvate-formate lyase-activating enzyme
MSKSPEAVAASHPDAHGHHEEGFWRKYVFSLDHKVIGVQYAITSLLFLFFGFSLMMLMRWQLAFPYEQIPIIGSLLGEANAPGGIMAPEFYNSLGAMHGTIMVFLGVVPLAVGAFGNFVVPLQIGAPDMAFPKLNMASYWTFLPGGLIMLASFFAPGGAANSGWTSYAPLSSIATTGQTMWLLGMVMLWVGAGSLGCGSDSEGREVSAAELSGMMVELQRQGCHNINFVTPSHYLPQILEALLEAVPAGLQVPLVWNCSGYESVVSLSLLEGIVDIYMPDIKCADSDPAERFFQAADYYARAKESVAEMHRQVGDLTLAPEGLALGGLLVRHLVLPTGLAGTEEVVRFLAEEISRETYLNIMEQYRPCGEAQDHRDIDRSITAEEYGRARDCAARAGLHRGIL